VISVVQLGTIDYTSGLALQQRLVDLRKAGRIGNVLLLLEHTPVITLGRNANAANVLASHEELARRRVEVFECDRGGDVTFHGPGQLVGYPIFDLRSFSHQPSALGSRGEPGDAAGIAAPGSKTLGAVEYVRRLEEALIRTCADFGFATKRIRGMTGVWTERPVAGFPTALPESETPAHPGAAEAKIAALGIHISRGVTSHGFALNVSTDLSYFGLIVPCGIALKPVTSVEKELGRRVEWNSVTESVVRNFGVVFRSEMLWVETVDALLGNGVGVPLKAPSDLRQLRGEEDLFLA